MTTASQAWVKNLCNVGSIHSGVQWWQTEKAIFWIDKVTNLKNLKDSLENGNNYNLLFWLIDLLLNFIWFLIKIFNKIQLNMYGIRYVNNSPIWLAAYILDLFYKLNSKFTTINNLDK